MSGTCLGVSVLISHKPMPKEILLTGQWDCFHQSDLGYHCRLPILPNLCSLPVETAKRVGESYQKIMPSAT